MEISVEQRKDNALREVRKLLSVLEGWGNILVPNLEGKTKTYAVERLEHFVNILKDEYQMSVEDIEKAIVELE